MTDNEIIKALECCGRIKGQDCDTCPLTELQLSECTAKVATESLDLINRQKAEIVKLEKIEHFADKTIEAFKRENEKQKAEIEKLNVELVGMRGACESYKMHYDNAQAEIERLKSDLTLKTYDYEHLLMKCKELQAISSSRKDRLMQTVVKLQTSKSEAIKEFAEKVTEIFKRYAHLHNHADQARRAEVEAADGTKIEMQSVWDVITLRKHGMAEYEEMSELQRNIEILEKDRLLTELEKDFRLLVKEMEGEQK